MRDALHNTSPRAGTNEQYCRGLVVGMVCGLMAEGFSHPAAIKEVALRLPEDCRPECLPDAFRCDLLDEMP